MKLYGSINRRSFNTMKIRAALAEAGASYQFVPVDLPKGQARTPEFLAMNPHAKIPVLLDGDFALAESDAILWYVADKHPAAGLLPARDDIQARARVLQWCAFASSALYAGYVEWAGPGKGTDPANRVAPVADGAMVKIRRALDVLETVLARHEHVAGASFSIADLSNAAIIQTLKQKMAEDPLAALPRTQAWYARVTARPAWKAALSESA
jgi:glutathione S-transferase